MKGNPFTGMGPGKDTPQGEAGGITFVHEKSYPKAKTGSHSKSHPSPGGSTQGPSGDIGHADSWNPREGG